MQSLFQALFQNLPIFLDYEVRMAIPYRTTKFKSANNIIFAIAILGSTAKILSLPIFLAIQYAMI